MILRDLFMEGRSLSRNQGGSLIDLLQTKNQDLYQELDRGNYEAVSYSHPVPSVFGEFGLQK